MVAERPNSRPHKGPRKPSSSGPRFKGPRSSSGKSGHSGKSGISGSGGTRGNRGDREERRPSPRDTGRIRRAPRIEPEIPVDVEAKMLPGKVRAELLSLSAENAEAVARQMVMIDRLILTGTPEDLVLAGAFAQAASDRAGRVGVVRSYAGKVLLALSNYSEAKRHLSAAHRINGQPFLKVLLAECETGLGKPRKSLDLLGEVDSKALTTRELASAHLVSAEAREALAQFEAARVSLNPKSEIYLFREDIEATEGTGGSDPERERLRQRWSGIKSRLAAKTGTSITAGN